MQQEADVLDMVIGLVGALWFLAGLPGVDALQVMRRRARPRGGGGGRRGGGTNACSRPLRCFQYEYGHIIDAYTRRISLTCFKVQESRKDRRTAPERGGRFPYLENAEAPEVSELELQLLQRLVTRHIQRRISGLPLGWKRMDTESAVTPAMRTRTQRASFKISSAQRDSILSISLHTFFALTPVMLAA